MRLLPFFSGRTSVPLVLQMEAVECGAACVAMILAHHGRRLPLEEVRHVCGVTRDGSNAGSMLKAARRYGLAAKGYRLDGKDLERARLPAVIHWEFNHFVVAERFTKDHVLLADPAVGKRRVTRKEFDGAFTGIALILEPGPDFAREDRRPPRIPQLLAMLRGAKGGLLLVGALSLLLTLVGFGVPVFTQIFVDNVIVKGQADWRTLLLWGLALMVSLQLLTSFLRQRIMVNIRLKLGFSMIDRFVEHIMALPIHFYTQRGTGDLITRVRLNEDVRMLLSDLAVTALLDIVFVFIYLILMMLYDLPLTGLVLLAAAVNVAAVLLVNRARINKSAVLLSETSKQRATEIRSLAMMETIKSSGSEGQAFARWRGLYVNAANCGQELGRLSMALDLAPAFTCSAVTGLVLWFGGLEVIAGTMTVGMVMAFQSLQAAFLAPITRLVGFCGDLQQAQGNVERINDVFRAERESAPADPADVGMLSGRIELGGISFGYSPTAKPLIDGLSIAVTPGARIALVGPSGSGKTTVAKLMVGILSPQRGTVRFDGVDIRDMDLDILRRQIGIVNQDSFLFRGTVAENLSLWDEEVSLADITRAAKDACVHEELCALPGGYDAMLDEGAANLSGGQRQRLCIARALAHDPAILLLDEATSALDAVTERRVDRNLQRRGCTAVIIAHRLSTIRNADEILVLDKGAVAERGRHEELMKLGGIYASLIRTG
ncbi:MAG: NHLP family bacteriocin export ABC transporter peptidase/permease/ATPase subunit [Elusimicrobiota bacterium]